MINRTFAITFGIGLLLVAVVITLVLHQQRGARLEWHGSVLKVRTAPMDETSTVMLVDFRLTNTADYATVLRTMSLEVETANGSVAEGVPIAASDVPRMFEFYKLLGEQYNPVLRDQDKVPAASSFDRMTAFRVPAPFADVEHRKSITLHLADSTGRATADVSAR